MDGLGAIKTVANPAAGANWSTSVPTGKRWRMWGGSCLLTTSSATGHRNPFLLYKDGTAVLWGAQQQNILLGSQPTNYVPPSSAVRLVFYEMRAELNDTYATTLGTFLPIGAKAIWLPAGGTITCQVQNLDAADQLSSIGLLIEELPA